MTLRTTVITISHEDGSKDIYIWDEDRRGWVVQAVDIYGFTTEDASLIENSADIESLIGDVLYEVQQSD